MITTTTTNTTPTTITITTMKEKRLQKSCIECTFAHRRCFYASTDDKSCTRCRKRTLQCLFCYSGKFFWWYFIQQKLSTYIYCYSYFLIPDQGHRNDLSNPPSEPCNEAVSNKIKATDIQSLSPPLKVISDSVHCNPLRQSSGSSGFSCHIDDTFSDEVDEGPSVVLNRPSSPPSWVHAFAKSSSTTSLCTQCAAAANMVVKSPKLLHRRLRRAKKKQRKSENVAGLAIIG